MNWIEMSVNGGIGGADSECLFVFRSWLAGEYEDRRWWLLKKMTHITNKIKICGDFRIIVDDLLVVAVMWWFWLW